MKPRAAVVCGGRGRWRGEGGGGKAGEGGGTKGGLRCFGGALGRSGRALVKFWEALYIYKNSRSTAIAAAMLSNQFVD